VQRKTTEECRHYQEQMTIHLEIYTTPSLTEARETGQVAADIASPQLAGMQVQFHGLWLMQPHQVGQSTGILTNRWDTMEH